MLSSWVYDFESMVKQDGVISRNLLKTKINQKGKSYSEHSVTPDSAGTAHPLLRLEFFIPSARTHIHYLVSSNTITVPMRQEVQPFSAPDLWRTELVCPSLNPAV